MHRAVYEKFKILFPDLLKNISRWSPYKSHQIKLYTDYGPLLIFTYHDKADWCLETIKSYLSN